MSSHPTMTRDSTSTTPTAPAGTCMPAWGDTSGPWLPRIMTLTCRVAECVSQTLSLTGGWVRHKPSARTRELCLGQVECRRTGQHRVSPFLCDFGSQCPRNHLNRFHRRDLAIFGTAPPRGVHTHCMYCKPKTRYVVSSVDHDVLFIG